MTINVKVGTNDRRTTVLVDDSKTIREVLEENDINYSTATVYLDGCSLTAGDFDKTLADFSITEACYLVAVIKSSNAR